jgi:predicted NAD/FAD-dependent oxidoreductase
VFFDAPASPHREPILVLNGSGTGPINHLAVMSEVSPGLAPAGRALVAVTVLDAAGESPSWDAEEDALVAAVRAQLASWYGEGARTWRLLRTYRIPHALPDDTPPTVPPLDRPVRVTRGLYACGDHRHHGSIDGALASGLRAAEAVLADRG